jgi:hypothetical protein
VRGVVDAHFEELNPRAGLHEVMRVIYDVSTHHSLARANC